MGNAESVTIVTHKRSFFHGLCGEAKRAKTSQEREFPAVSSSETTTTVELLPRGAKSNNKSGEGNEVYTLLNPNNGLVIVGSTEHGYNLTYSLLWDHENYKKLCRDICFDWQEAFGTQTLTTEAVIAFLIQCGASKGYSKDALSELIQHRGYKGKQMVKMFIQDLVESLKDLSHPDAKKKDKRATRGEHVINNGVLAVNRDIINKFLDEYNKILRARQMDTISMDTIGLPPDCELLKNYHRPIDNIISGHIQTDLVVHIPLSVIYIDTNCVKYGTTIKLLRDYTVKHMIALYDTARIEANQGSDWTKPLRETIAQITGNLIFVDDVARQRWLNENPRNEQKYSNAEQAVKNMFTELYDRSRSWVRQIRSAYYHKFNTN